MSSSVVSSCTASVGQPLTVTDIAALGLHIDAYGALIGARLIVGPARVDLGIGLGHAIDIQIGRILALLPALQRDGLVVPVHRGIGRAAGNARNAHLIALCVAHQRLVRFDLYNRWLNHTQHGNAGGASNGILSHALVFTAIGDLYVVNAAGLRRISTLCWPNVWRFTYRM